MLAQFLVVLLSAAVGAGLAAVMLYWRLRRRILLRVVRAVDALQTGDVITNRRDPPALSAALHALRRRQVTQIGLIDRERQMLQFLLDHLQEGLIVVRDGRIALLNPIALRMLSLTARAERGGNFIGEPVETVILDHQLQCLLSPSVGMEQGGEGGELGREKRIEIESEHGTTHLLARAVDVVLGEAGPDWPESRVGRVVMLTDITALQRIIQIRTDFAANASHELRTPLATIRAALEALLTVDAPANVPPARDFVEKIDRHSARLELIIADLLDLSRLETPAQRFEAEEVDCKRLLQDLQARFAEALERKGLRWDATREPADLRNIRANPHLLRLALDNLVDNAIKFTDAGGHVAVRLRSSLDEAVFEVCDDGCGIPEDEQQRVFERFYQVERARSGAQRGSGLGLSIVRHAVGALHGSVRLESRVGRGTRVTVVIPQRGGES
jgi:two-component system, OmpR family, phosphate regulon sensor histidine kinase PhoR